MVNLEGAARPIEKVARGQYRFRVVIETPVRADPGRIVADPRTPGARPRWSVVLQRRRGHPPRNQADSSTSRSRLAKGLEGPETTAGATRPASQSVIRSR